MGRAVTNKRPSRHRHLLNDLYSLLPHSRKDAKLDTKTKLYQLNELADLYNCNNVLFFEARKGKDLYIWMSKAPNGPTVKMYMQNCRLTTGLHDTENPELIPNEVHTMSELHFPGNCLKGSRPILSFDATFDTAPHLLVIKDLLTHIFGVPQTSRKIKPFIDHVMGFTVADGKIWIRCFEIKETEVAKNSGEKSAEGEASNRGGADDTVAVVKSHGKKDTAISLMEIGPRFVLTPIVILESSFGGPVIYENKQFVSPNHVRAELRRAKAGRHSIRAEGIADRKRKNHDLGLSSGAPRREREGDELDERRIFA